MSFIWPLLIKWGIYFKKNRLNCIEFQVTMFKKWLISFSVLGTRWAWPNFLRWRLVRHRVHSLLLHYCQGMHFYIQTQSMRAVFQGRCFSFSLAQGLLRHLQGLFITLLSTWIAHIPPWNHSRLISQSAPVWLGPNEGSLAAPLLLLLIRLALPPPPVAAVQSEH